MDNSKQQIKLYFDEYKTCFGGVANNWWQRDFSGHYWASDYFWLSAGYNPIGKSWDELSQFIGSKAGS